MNIVEVLYIIGVIDLLYLSYMIMTAFVFRIYTCINIIKYMSLQFNFIYASLLGTLSKNYCNSPARNTTILSYFFETDIEMF